MNWAITCCTAHGYSRACCGTTCRRKTGGHLSESALKRIEEEADLFAAKMLMPEQWVRAWFAQQQREWDLSAGLAGSRLATLLLVSRQAAIKRLAALGLTIDTNSSADCTEDEGGSRGMANDG